MAPACSAAARAGHRVSAPVPVAWLEGDVLAEYLLFLEETATPPPAPSATRVPVAWLEGEARDEFLRFLEEARAKEAAAAAEVGLEQPQQQEEEEEHGSGNAARGGDADGHDDAGESSLFMEEDDAGGMEGDDESGDGGVYMDKHEQEAEAVLELLLPHILDLPAFRARAAATAAAPVQQEPVLDGFPWYHGGWLQDRVSSFLDVDSCTSSSSSDDEEMSSAEDEFEEGVPVNPASDTRVPPES